MAAWDLEGNALTTPLQIYDPDMNPYLDIKSRKIKFDFNEIIYQIDIFNFILW